MLGAQIITIVLLVVGCGLTTLAISTRIPLLGVLALAFFAAAFIRRRSTVVRGLFATLGVALTGAIGYVWWNSELPAPGAFYQAQGNAAAAPGALLRSEPFTHNVPAGARAWRILYTTTTSTGAAATGTAFVLASAQSPAGPRPVVLWAHGTTGIAPTCAPTLLPDPFPFIFIPALDLVIKEGWVLIGTDYAGLGTAAPHEYLVGEAEARSTIDSMRAARQLEGLTLDARALVWGHSQGGHAAMWTGIVAPKYAPEIELLGVAAFAPGSDLLNLMDAIKETLVGRILASYVVTAYARVYPDVRPDDYLGTPARANRMASTCLSPPGVFLPIMTSASLERALFTIPPTSGPLGERLRHNSPTASIAAPVMIAQGLGDDIVLPDIQARFVKERCEAGQPIDYRTYAALDHLTLVNETTPLAPEIMEWSRARFAGRAAEPRCVTVSR